MVDDMLELRGYACQLPTEKLMALEDVLAKLENLKPDATPGARCDERVQQKISAFLTVA